MTPSDLNTALSEKGQKYFRTYLLRAIKSFYPVFLVLLVFLLDGVVKYAPTPYYLEAGSDRHWGAG